jgi:hypothetical protein
VDLGHDEVARRERVMGLGPIHTVDLEEARDKAREYRKLLMAGKDPLWVGMSVHELQG